MKFVSSIKNQTKKLAFIFLHQKADVEVETVLNEISGASIQLLNTMSDTYSLQHAGVEDEESNITPKQCRKLSEDLKIFRTTTANVEHEMDIDIETKFSDIRNKIEKKT